MRAPERGFTLIELIVGIVLLAVALTGILGLLINQAPQAVDPVQQVRGAQLAQRLAGEIQQTSFDELSDHNGGRYRCGETVAGVTIPACSTHYGPDGEATPYMFNDVDDFDTAGSWKAASFYTQSGGIIASDEYRNYQVRITVSPVDFSDGNFKNCASPCSVGKRIDLQVRLPDESVLDFSFYRGNY
ncbi:prepilin-type N-terminal cleavage/methylation domain-containing protein [Aeromonas sp. BC14]|uniref:prepilin-type N-terminal cleavage/methylation domain-containing protein n=1 Tax=Aeromonas hydrophila TaxID=644 RepID=UPI00191D4135|nr:MULTISPECIES: prepilin-type N-terminal cleavage/methylation domain-containing protein [Aeromonas]MBL0570596.1 prepilin-type N-terminal cleavage/methylation domain-containing protein [Aeromonas hydrophila]WAF94270.1 prepilin-type N-terminal cleavage/methylation domain-containing protein [Aeromonas sp. BC14]